MRNCVRCSVEFNGGTLLCPDCQQTALEAIARQYPGDTEGTDDEALDKLTENIKAIYEEEPDAQDEV